MSGRFPLTAALVAALSISVSAACDGGVVEPVAQEAAEGSFAFGTGGFGGWSAPVRVEDIPGTHPEFNTGGLDGCPFISRDGKSFYTAAVRDGSRGIDIYVSTRAKAGDPWGPAVNVGEPVNSAGDDFCPTLDRDGHRFFFVSTRGEPGSCGGGDIYVTRLQGDGTFAEPTNLGCEVNSGGNEAGPFPLPEAGSGPVLYFSSSPGPGQPGDIYRSESHGGVFGPRALVPGVNSAADDGQPNLRRDGLEMFFYSTRPDPAAQSAAPDLYSATRASTSDPWSTPVNLGPVVNSAAGETRPSLSWDGTELYFGSNRPGTEAGSADIFVTTRERD